MGSVTGWLLMEHLLRAERVSMPTSAMVANSPMSLVGDTVGTTAGRILGDQSVLRGAGAPAWGWRLEMGALEKAGELTEDQ